MYIHTIIERKAKVGLSATAYLRRDLKEGAMSISGEAVFQQVRNLIFVLEGQGGWCRDRKGVRCRR